jgi:hypothetical protein
LKHKFSKLRVKFKDGCGGQEKKEKDLECHLCQDAPCL